jgi:hypothetical protein
MGDYVNPDKGTKEEWLAEYGQPISRDEVADFTDFSGDEIVVGHIDNKPLPFTAAWIMADEKEQTDLLTEDGRKKTFYLVKVSDICKASESYARYRRRMGWTT